MNTNYLSVASHDAFRFGGLGKSSAEAYWFLHTYGPMTDQELSARTGRSLRTIQRVLGIMSRIKDTRTGELIQMVTQEDQRWRAFDVDLDHIALIKNTAGTGRRQRAQHRREREMRRETLAAMKRSQLASPTAEREVGSDAAEM